MDELAEEGSVDPQPCTLPSNTGKHLKHILRHRFFFPQTRPHPPWPKIFLTIAITSVFLRNFNLSTEPRSKTKESTNEQKYQLFNETDWVRGPSLLWEQNEFAHSQCSLLLSEQPTRRKVRDHEADTLTQATVSTSPSGERKERHQLPSCSGLVIEEFPITRETWVMAITGQIYHQEEEGNCPKVGST